jgi:hypothetical protein
MARDDPWHGTDVDPRGRAAHAYGSYKLTLRRVRRHDRLSIWMEQLSFVHTTGLRVERPTSSSARGSRPALTIMTDSVTVCIFSRTPRHELGNGL